MRTTICNICAIFFFSVAIYAAPHLPPAQRSADLPPCPTTTKPYHLGPNEMCSPTPSPTFKPTTHFCPLNQPCTTPVPPGPTF